MKTSTVLLILAAFYVLTRQNSAAPLTTQSASTGSLIDTIDPGTLPLSAYGI